MQLMKHSLIALAVAAASSQLALADSEINQADAKGFLEGTDAQVLLRNTYWNRDYRDQQQDRAAWAQGFIGTFNSGFTQGTVGFGIDAFGLLGVKLDGGRGKAGGRSMGGLLAAHGNGSPRDEWGQIGAAAKVRFSSTVLKYGHQMPDLPVLSIDDTRLLPESFTGTLLTSQEIEGLQIDIGRFTQNSPMAWSSRDPNKLKSINIAGARYTTPDENTSVALYGSKLEDVLKKYYAGAYQNIPLGDEQSIEIDFNLYRTKYDSKFGGGRNTIWSLQSTYNIGGHGLIAAYQQSSGSREYFYDVGDGGGTIYLANSFFSDFNSKKEKSLQAGYSLDFSEYGVEGLSWRTAYVYGVQSKSGNGVKKASERDFYNQIAYTVQSGSMKDLSFRVRNGIFRANNNHSNKDQDMNEWRLFVEYPLDLTF